MPNVKYGVSNDTAICDDITKLPHETLEALDCGDFVIEKNGSEAHAYRVSHKEAYSKATMTYVDRQAVKTITYEYNSEIKVWVYSSSEELPLKESIEVVHIEDTMSITEECVGKILIDTNNTHYYPVWSGDHIQGNIGVWSFITEENSGNNSHGNCLNVLVYEIDNQSSYMFQLANTTTWFNQTIDYGEQLSLTFPVEYSNESETKVIIGNYALSASNNFNGAYYDRLAGYNFHLVVDGLTRLAVSEEVSFDYEDISKAHLVWGAIYLMLKAGRVDCVEFGGTPFIYLTEDLDMTEVYFTDIFGVRYKAYFDNTQVKLQKLD